jgi:SAM-dependent methyltransferase
VKEAFNLDARNKLHNERVCDLIVISSNTETLRVIGACPMAVQDAFQVIDSLERDTIARFIVRLEQRGRDPQFSQWRDAYLDRLDLGRARQVLDIGCGTGVIGRAIARRSDFDGTVIGIDPSRSLLEAAEAFARDEGVGARLRFQYGTAESLPFEEDSFDCVVAHTTISHVPDPSRLLSEMARVLRPGGNAVIFDGDYASWTFDYPDPEFGKRMDEALIQAVVANPRIMRGLRRDLSRAGLETTDILSWIYVDTADGEFYRPALSAYTPVMIRAGTADEGEVERWLAHIHQAMATHQYFAACCYYAYVARPLDTSAATEMTSP